MKDFDRHCANAIRDNPIGTFLVCPGCDRLTVPWRSRSGDRNVDWPGVSAPGLLFVPWLRANRGFTSVGKMLDLRTVDCREASKSWVNSALWPVPPAIVFRTVQRGGCRFRADRAGIGGAPLAGHVARIAKRVKAAAA